LAIPDFEVITLADKKKEFNLKGWTPYFVTGGPKSPE
jgi:hypothetical protein